MTADAKKKEAREDKAKVLELAIAAMEKEFGKGIMFKWDDNKTYEHPSISTGALTLDLALGIGGVPRGRLVEIYGPESSGKSTLCLTIVAEAQKAGGVCAYVDSEHALDPSYARALGVRFNELLISQPDYGEQALDVVDHLVHTGAVDLIVVDSVAALSPKEEWEAGMEKKTMGSLAKMMSHHTRKINSVAGRTGTTLLYVNQIREKIGVLFGSPETTPGGRALRFDTSVRMDIRRIEELTEGTNKIGHRVRVRVVKNKMAPPFKEAEFDILWGKGINKFGCVLDMATEEGLLSKKGAYYYTSEGTLIGQGRKKAYEYLASDLELYEQLKKEILNGPQPSIPVPDGDDTTDE